MTSREAFDLKNLEGKPAFPITPPKNPNDLESYFKQTKIGFSLIIFKLKFYKIFICGVLVLTNVPQKKCT